MSNSFIIANTRIIDPFTDTDCEGDIFIRAGIIQEGSDTMPADAREIDGAGLICAPAFSDIHVHFREPGGEHSETVASGCLAAACGGFGAVAPMPNTTPPLDRPDRVRWQIEEASRHSPVRIMPSACITVGRQGRELTDMRALAEAGAAFFTDDGSTVRSDELMREAMARAAELGMVVVDHAQRSTDEKRGVMHAGSRSADLGLPGISTQAEAEVIERDIQLAEATGCAVHIQHITSAAGVKLVGEGKARGVKVSAELTPHHLLLCDQDIPGDDANFKMNPPLRSPADRAALRAGILAGDIDCFATDHAPHHPDLKAKGFLKAPFGVVGLETAVGVTFTELVVDGSMGVREWIAAWTSSPLGLIGRAGTPLTPGSPSRLVLLDPAREWRVDPSKFHSLSRNSCFQGRHLHCRVRAVILDGIYIESDG